MLQNGMNQFSLCVIFQENSNCLEIRVYDYMVWFEKVFTSLESRKLRLTDMLIDGTISKEMYEKLRERLGLG